MKKWLSIGVVTLISGFGPHLAQAGASADKTELIRLAQSEGSPSRPEVSVSPRRSYVAACDRAAADPLDPERRGAGVDWNNMHELPNIIASCRAAVREQPNQRRLLFQLGRALHKHGRYSEAATWYRKAAHKNHMTAQNNLAFLYDRGSGVARDEQKAIHWYREAARRGSKNSRHALEKRGINW